MAKKKKPDSIIGQMVTIDYIDVNGERTTRSIRVLQYYDDISPRLYAMCFIRNEPRAFRIERIEELTDRDGVVWDPVDWLGTFGIEVDPSALGYDADATPVITLPRKESARERKRREAQEALRTEMQEANARAAAREPVTISAPEVAYGKPRRKEEASVILPQSVKRRRKTKAQAKTEVNAIFGCLIMVALVVVGAVWAVKWILS